MIDYKSPIEIWHSEMEMQLEGEVLKACQRVGVQVDKEELLKALRFDRGRYERGYQDGLNADKWIPCEERLPSEDEEVIISTKTERVYIGVYTTRYGENKREGFICEDGFIWMNVTNAWQPLPQPYKKEGAENEM